ncbi:DUF2332 domain-containing protein [Streptosporangium canum]|uniref:DUF2332 domain-containing protein n=1 Tax=Streptosporangium canum TaxID=324952 RepID=UPI0037A7C543
MSQERAAVMVEHQARGCAELGSPLYAFLLGRVARDVREGGPCAQALAGYGDAPGPDAVALRLLGGVHALALTGRAPDLAACYPSTGGVFDPDRPEPCWQAFRAAVATGMEWVRDWMTRPPQTNETGRANLLIAGLLRATRTSPLPVRLFELGSSAGLNLRADRFRYVSEGFAWGPADSPVLLEDAWRGAPPTWLLEAAARRPALTVVERRGCDVTPIDPLSSGGALALRAYIWPDQTARAARLEGALRVAARVPAGVEAVGAADFLAGVRPEPGTLTVVWHSIMRQYVPAAEWARVERELDRLAEAATAEAGFAHVSFEPRRVGERHRFRLAVRLGGVAEEALAEAPPHGLPAREVTTA